LFEGGFKIFDEHRELVGLFEAFVSEPADARYQKDSRPFISLYPRLTFTL